MEFPPTNAALPPTSRKKWQGNTVEANHHWSNMTKQTSSNRYASSQWSNSGLVINGSPSLESKHWHHWLNMCFVFLLSPSNPLGSNTSAGATRIYQRIMTQQAVNIHPQCSKYPFGKVFRYPKPIPIPLAEWILFSIMGLKQYSPQR